MRNQATGGANLIANLNLSLKENQTPFLTSMDLNPADGQIYAYLFNQGKDLSLSNTSAQRALETPRIVTIDTKTGDVEFRVSTIELVSAITFVPVRNLNIPTLSEWGLIILALCMLMGSLAVLRRRAGKGTV
jgi:hypothetical protein